MRLILIVAVLAACGGGQRGDGAATVGYCGKYADVDPMLNEPTHAGFCERTRDDCEVVADDYRRRRKIEVSCAPASVMHCWESASPSKESCFFTADQCEESRAAAEPDPDREDIMGASPAPGPCGEFTAP